ncbi:S8 family serine peptidase [Cryobacterium sp. CG_9.6]|uniref:S8 family serine peptidase n=1 Tax=Cryobacterium sp. CG_9.6 TaxID=2760710 RepID=UPI00247529E3|nr:S8 family serine peptidase [Cryobacterium sp. CG_9.6]MDH6237929.1 subtilisin family serine protease [Cryobacterium sp. CG_9.6]
MSSRFWPPTSHPTPGRRLRGITAVGLTAVLVSAASLVAAGGAVAVPLQSALGAKVGAGLSQPITDLTAGRYIVTLADDAVATYDGGVDGFSATKPDTGKKLNTQSRASQSYAQYLGGKQKDAAASVDADIAYSYTLALNGFAADLSAEQAVKLSAEKNVVSMTRDELRQITATSSTDFLGLSGDNGVWNSIGGADQAGQGVVVGILDTGIAPENPSFAGSALGTTAGTDPYLDGSTIRFDKADGGVFTGSCITGIQFTATDCNTKVVSARYFVDGFGASRIGSTSVGEYLSPRDGDGHGSHTASTAAGNYNVPVAINGLDYGVISGVAPAAKVAAYKVCWSGPDAVGSGDDGCATSDMIAAIDQSVADGVDVLNFSIGGGAATTTVSPTDVAFLGAASAGIFVAASAGNSGPGSSTLDNASPWITTVAASTIPGYEATATFGDGQAYAGASISVDRTVGATPVSGPLVRADLVAAAGQPAADALLCAPNSLDPAKVAGTIVFCQRGVYDRVAKSAEVLRAGGIGMLLVNRTSSSIDSDAHSVPTVHLDGPYWDASYAYAATAGATVTFTPDNSTSYTPPTPVVAGFSSRGPVLADGSDILKPDISAPGVAILADGANPAGGAPTWQFLSGTSMSSPHIAGLAALYLGERPLASPAEIKSAMMTSAYNTVDSAGNPVTDPFTQGAGHVDPTKFFDPGLLYLSGTADWYGFIQGIGYDVGVPAIDPSNLNLPSIAIGALTAPETITRTVTSTRGGEFTAQPVSLPGMDAVVSPSTLSFGAAGETQSYTVTFSRTDAPLDQFSTGSLDWVTGSGTDRVVVHTPIAVQPITLSAPATAEGTGIDGSTDVTITPGSTGDLALNLSGLAAGLRQPNVTDPTSANTGSGAAGDEFSYEVQVPEGTQLARFDLDAIDNTSDLDLVVYRLDGPGGVPVAGWQSATGAADERVDLANPSAGSYQVLAIVYSGTTAFDVTTFSVLAGAGDGGFAAAPPVVPGEQGVPVSYTLSWAGLTPDTSYLGLVGYGDTAVTTALSVKSGAAPVANSPVNTVLPSITGNPTAGSTLSAEHGDWTPDGLTYTYQWQADGADIRKATSAEYKVGKKDVGKTLTVVVTAAATGLDSASATSAGVVVKGTSSTKLSLEKSSIRSSQSVGLSVEVTTDGAAADMVTVTVGTTTYPVTLDQKGKGQLTLSGLKPGSYEISAAYAGTDLVAGSTSKTASLRVTR